MRSKNYIYIIHELSTENYKIGRASDPIKRLSNIQTCNAHNLELLYIWKVPEKHKGLIEKCCHLSLRNYNIKNKWFKIPKDKFDDVIDTISKITKSEVIEMYHSIKKAKRVSIEDQINVKAEAKAKLDIDITIIK